jgi:hypothetical protein
MMCLIKVDVESMGRRQRGERQQDQPRFVFRVPLLQAPGLVELVEAGALVTKQAVQKIRAPPKPRTPKAYQKSATLKW